MLPVDNEIWQLAEAKLSGKLTPAELESLERHINNDESFGAEFNECISLLQSLEANGRRMRFMNTLKEAENMPSPSYRTYAFKPWRIAAIAAGIALITSGTTAYFFNHTNKKVNSQYQVLVNIKHDLENIKRNQNQLNQIIQDQKTVTTPKPTTPDPSRYSGTGFAISNNGYIATNFHVIEGADSLYIETRDGLYYRAYLVDADTHNDLAVLKIEDKDFTFGKGELPYRFDNNMAALGSRVFTIGYPQDELRYNEGYVSARKGFDGDSNQYRLELPANPGTSGAPVVDANGNIVAVVTGKESQSEGTTYAVSSKALLQMLHSLPKEESLKLPKANKINSLTREQQIEKLQDYTCLIHVYKK